ncbi:glycosyltransferase [Amphritea balenae]|uniref:Glycosyltransferase family 2 protein n=1 Tax=Amphritea balenae TaxID=452629 RepID=A0A3P1SWA4_9GAMM|nr:glycosyltransferase [Amphritea balenae]RRD01318.1 glycosyltransferase family 2 protein [Amphritea balenae]GGK58216.1 glycosyl transferase [Amphritea balenae]
MEVLYSVPVNVDGDFETLSYSFNKKKFGPSPYYNGSKLIVSKGTLVKFDSLFASFFESVWLKHTSVKNISIRVKVKGECEVSIFRKRASSARELINKCSSDDNELIDFKYCLDQCESTFDSRLWVEIKAIDDIEIESLEWCCLDGVENKNVSIGVCFATYNRVEYLDKVVRSIIENDISKSAVEKIIIVNQGDDFKGEESFYSFLDNNNGLINVVNQENLGGCGGFTRGIHELLSIKKISHVLLCDDDIMFEPYSLERLFGFLKYSTEDIAVGGQMLDILKPSVLYENGAVLKEKTLTPKPIDHNISMSEVDSLDILNVQKKLDYNGWWYFCVSRKSVEKVKYPMPCFIRGDDIEYGVRLNRAGIETVVIPGLVVWHEPFYLKLDGWQYYYEVKNRLVLRSIHYAERNIKDELSSLTAIFLRDLLTCRYHSAQLCIKAIEDYLAGSEETLTCDPGKLADIRNIVRDFGPKSIDNNTSPLQKETHFNSLIGNCPTILVWVLAFVRNMFSFKTKNSKYVDARDVTIGKVMFMDEFVVKQRDGLTFVKFSRSRKQFFSMLFRFIKAYISLKNNYPSLKSKYQSDYKDLIKPEYWISRYF